MSDSRHEENNYDSRHPSAWARARLLELAVQFRDNLETLPDNKTRALFEFTFAHLIALEEAFAQVQAPPGPAVRR